jgi:hypothetical protein
MVIRSGERVKWRSALHRDCEPVGTRSHTLGYIDMPLTPEKVWNAMQGARPHPAGIEYFALRL